MCGLPIRQFWCIGEVWKLSLGFRDLSHSSCGKTIKADRNEGWKEFGRARRRQLFHMKSERVWWTRTRGGNIRTTSCSSHLSSFPFFSHSIRASYNYDRWHRKTRSWLLPPEPLTIFFFRYINSSIFNEALLLLLFWWNIATCHFHAVDIFWVPGPESPQQVGSDLSIKKNVSIFFNNFTNRSDVHMKCSKLKNTLKLCLKTKVLEPQESRAKDSFPRQAASVSINKLQQFVTQRSRNQH